MKQQQELLVWIGLIVAAVIGLITWIVVVSPSPEEVKNTTRPLAPLPTDALDATNFDLINNLDTNGTLPVSPSPANPPRTDPFSG